MDPSREPGLGAPANEESPGLSIRLLSLETNETSPGVSEPERRHPSTPSPRDQETFPHGQEATEDGMQDDGVSDLEPQTGGPITTISPRHAAGVDLIRQAIVEQLRVAGLEQTAVNVSVTLAACSAPTVLRSDFQPIPPPTMTLLVDDMIRTAVIAAAAAHRTEWEASHQDMQEAEVPDGAMDPGRMFGTIGMMVMTNNGSEIHIPAGGGWLGAVSIASDNESDDTDGRDDSEDSEDSDDSSDQDPNPPECSCQVECDSDNEAIEDELWETVPERTLSWEGEMAYDQQMPDLEVPVEAPVLYCGLWPTLDDYSYHNRGHEDDDDGQED